MARYNEILVGRFARMVQKLFGMKGEVPVGSLAGELSVIFPLINGVENRYLESWDRFAFAGTQAGAAAANATWQIRNPAGSNVVMVIEKITVAATNTGFSIPAFRHGALTTDLATVASYNNPRLDSRGRPNPTAIISSATNVSGGLANKVTVAGLLNTSVDFFLFEEQEVNLLPGDAAQIVEGIANQALTVSWVWRERFLEESERT